MKTNPKPWLYGPNCQGQRCGAKTRRGTPCQRPARLPVGRCKLHGGASTGPRTKDGLARLAIADMRKQLDAGLGKKVYADYIVCIERYLIPYFGSQYVTSIDYEKVQSFYEWRRAKMGREPTAHPTQLSRWIHTVNPISPFMQQSRVAFLSFRKCANRNKEMGTGSF